jgi:hypothetical protein
LNFYFNFIKILPYRYIIRLSQGQNKGRLPTNKLWGKYYAFALKAIAFGKGTKKILYMQIGGSNLGGWDF